MNELIAEFRQRLVNWGRDNTKHYPWRWIDDPYRVLVAEFMLHRTQVKQVVTIYEQFVALCPTLHVFSQTDEIQLRDILEPLGLHWRIDGMLKALRHLWERFGEVPTNREKLMAVDSVGQYIAGATICFAKNEPVTLIDTNTVRVIGRILGLDLSGEARRKKTVIEAIAFACDPIQPRDYYYAMIDLAHQICTPKSPACNTCPLFDLPCYYGGCAFNTPIYGDDDA